MTAFKTLRLHFLFANSQLREAILLLAATASFISGSVAQIKPLSEDELGRLLAKAENGSRVAQVQVGKAYELGRAGNIDYEQAARWYRKAADQGDPDAQNNLGVLYLSGRGVPRDPVQAERWLLRSASTGFPLAQHNLGILYLGGWQIPADPERGMELVRRAATAGLEVSQLQLGFAYLTCRLIPNWDSSGQSARPGIIFPQRSSFWEQHTRTGRGLNPTLKKHWNTIEVLQSPDMPQRKTILDVFI